MFAQLRSPVGVTTDLDGNVWVHSDSVSATLLTQFAPDGSVLRQIPLGNFLSVGLLGHLATDPANGLIWLLANNGLVILVDPATGQSAPYFNVRDFGNQWDTSAVWDISTQTVGSFGSYIIASQTSFGDIALFPRGGERLDVFVTGISVGTPFVMRIRFSDPHTIESLKVIASSRFHGSISGLPRGVAVSRLTRTVLTTLPKPDDINPQNFSDRAIVFGADYPESGGVPPQFLFNQQDLFSYGMTVDAAGTYYISTPNTSLCLPGPVSGFGLLVQIPADFQRQRVGCGYLNLSAVVTPDAVLNEAGDTAYQTVYSPLNGDGIVVKWAVEAPPQPPPSSFDTEIFLPAVKR